jgi:hypothetical protein
MATRKQFMQQSAALAIGAWLFARCTNGESKSIPVSDSDQDAAIGHRLRDMQFPEPSAVEEVGVIIIGSGVSGLSAARTLSQSQFSDAIVLELSKRVGGNAASGAIGEMRFPLGAHYLPVVNPTNVDLIAFLRESEIITSIDAAGVPTYREEYLVHSPDERIFMRGQWHDGLIALKHLGAEDHLQFEQFTRAMDSFRDRKGNDGLYVFDLPLRKCSADTTHDELDSMTMKEWMTQQGWNSEYLLWLVDYACRDDFGAGVDEVSAWAGIHYYAARRGNGAHVDRNDVLSWPEGNGFLVDRLNEQHQIPIRHQQLVYAVNKTDHNFEVLVYDVPNDRSIRYRCKAVIGALPLYLATRFSVYSETQVPELQYAPWLVANIHFNDPNGELFNFESYWDNVLYNSPSLGYIQSGHQRFHAHFQEGVMTYYYALQGSDEREVRKSMREKSLDQWIEEVFADLSTAHPKLRNYVKSAEIKLWGHAMLKPLVGSMRGAVKAWRSASPEVGYFVAHSDCGGLSLFEEAFDSGRQAALQTLKYIKA